MVSCFRGLVGRLHWRCLFNDILAADRRLQGLVRDTCFQEVMTMIPCGSQNMALLLRDTFCPCKGHPFIRDRGCLLPSSDEWASGVSFWDSLEHLHHEGFLGNSEIMLRVLLDCFANCPTNSRYQLGKAVCHTSFIFLQSLWNRCVNHVQRGSIVCG